MIGPSICVVGSTMVDMVARTPRLPGPGETVAGTGFATGFGGKGANQAVMAARLGAEVTMVAKVGDDAFGRDTISNFRVEGIATDHIGIAAGLPSGVAPIWVDEGSGQNAIIVVPGANLALAAADVRAAGSRIAAAGVVVCQLETPVAATIEAFRIARSSGTMTVLNPAPAMDLPDELLALTDVLVPNESEAALLAGIATGDEAGAAAAGRSLQARGPRLVVVTLGARGALLLDGAEAPLAVAAAPVQAVDSTGAGDAFVGAFAVLLALGRPPAAAVEHACRIASRTVLKHGTQSSYPDRDEARELLA